MIKLSSSSSSASKFYQQTFLNVAGDVNLNTHLVLNHNLGIVAKTVKVFRIFDDASELIVHDLYFAGGHVGYLIADTSLNSVTIWMGTANIDHGQSDWDYRIELYS